MPRVSKAATGTFEELLEGVDPKVATICRRLRKMIKQVDPKTVETVRLGDNAATYGLGPRKMTDGYAYIMPLREHVNLGFYLGASLPDPFALLDGTGKALRHIKIRTPAEASSPALQQYVAAALAARRR